MTDAVYFFNINGEDFFKNEAMCYSSFHHPPFKTTKEAVITEGVETKEQVDFLRNGN